MAYSTGVSTSPDDLLNKIAVFLAANGWTVDSNGADSVGLNGRRVHAHNGGIFLSARAALNESLLSGTPMNGILFYLGTGYNGSNPWESQAGGPLGNSAGRVASGIALPAGAVVAYHLFADAGGANIVVVVETTGGVFNHMGFGTSLIKSGGYTGGEYQFGSSPGWSFAYWPSGFPGQGLTASTPFHFEPALPGAPAFVRADVDSFTGKWLGLSGNSTIGSQGYTGKTLHPSVFFSSATVDDIPHYQAFQDRQVSIMNGSANLLPLRLYCARDTSGYTLIGHPANVFYSNAVGRGFSPGTIYSLGADDYMLFPNFAVKKV